MPPKVEAYLCQAEVPDISTYRHIYSVVSKCVPKGVYDLDKFPEDVADKLLRRGEVALTEPRGDVLAVIGVEELGDYQYVRLSLRPM